MARYYFGLDESFCATKEYFQNEINESREVINLYEAKRIVNCGYFYCTYYLEIGVSGEGCGKICEAYKPRNGKNGRCVYSAHCYEKTDKKITIKPEPKQLFLNL